ncbi:MAG: U32 family peptidase C-terminal domain-containing protein, partial [Acholeplasmataceae bacterium]|nr:U32 family peptidase C-terminal domain-containing protein [Acholeplasmataceae bacterium]
LQKAENRLTSHGYLEGLPGVEQQLFKHRSEQPTQLFIGLVKSYDLETQIAFVEQRNHFETGNNIEILSPSGSEQSFILGKMTDENDEPLDVARHPKQIVKMKIPFKVEPYAMLRKK